MQSKYKKGYGCFIISGSNLVDLFIWGIENRKKDFSKKILKAVIFKDCSHSGPVQYQYFCKGPILEAIENRKKCLFDIQKKHADHGQHGHHRAFGSITNMLR